MEAFLVLFIGAILIVVLNRLPEKDSEKRKKHPLKSIRKMFESFHEESIDPKETKKIKKEKRSRKEELLKTAEEYLLEGNQKEAEKFYIEVLKIDEREPKSYKGLGQICFERKNYKDAYEIFEKLTKLIPNDASNYCNLGMCCFKEKNFKEAIKNYEKAISIEKKPAYYKNLGITQIRLKKYNDASDSFITVLEKKKDEEVFKLLLSIIPEIKDKKKAKKILLYLEGYDPKNVEVKRQLSKLK